MLKSQRMFENQVRRNNYAPAAVWQTTTAQRKTKVVPVGVMVWDTTLKALFVGDGTQAGGVSASGNREVRSITNAAASAFTTNDTFKTIASAVGATDVFTSNAHGFVDGDVVIAMATDATYALTQDTEYTVNTATTNTFKLTGVNVTGDQTANLVVKKKLTAGNNYCTWAEAAYLRTGDGVTLTNSTGTLPSGLSNATEYYIVKVDSDPNGGIDRNVTTAVRFSDSRAHALAGTDIITIRDAGTVGFKAVSSDLYATGIEDVVVQTSAVSVDFYLPDAAATVVGKQYAINNPGGGAVTVKAVGGTVDGAAAGTGKVLKASSNDFITVVCDGTNWVAVSKQITP